MKVDLQCKPVLVTGGTGFIGRHLVSALLKQGAGVTVLSRHAPPASEQGYRVISGDLTRPASLEGLCQGMHIVFHLGGHAHAVDQPDGKSEKTNWQVTVEGTRALVEQSLKAGVSRFVFFSSVKAMGEGGETRLDETAVCRPATAYGRAKHEAEKFVLDAARHGLPAVVLRMPMVYGPGVKGNLPRMIQAIAYGRFPPLPEIYNKRSMVHVDDVVRAALLAAERKEAAGKLYIVTDGRVYSTRQIYEWICEALSRPVPRWSIPVGALRAVARMGDLVVRAGFRNFPFNSEALEKLIGSAWYSSDRITAELGFRPTRTLRDSLPEMIAQYRADRAV